MAAIPKDAKERADASLRASMAQADNVVTLADADGEKARAELLNLLREADKRLARKLAIMTPPGKEDLRFTAAQAIGYRTQVQLMIGHVEGKVADVAVSVGNKAVAKSAAEGQALVAKLERDFKGVSASPSVMAAMQQSQALRGPKAALVTRVATSVDRYGLEMGSQFSKIISVGLASGASNAEMVAALVQHGGPRGPKVSLAARETAPGVVQRIREGDIPEGLFVRHKYWAERIVRTEVAFAYSGTRYEQLLAMRAAGHDEVKKKIVAVFDTRTAPDSVAVHGQVRELEQEFVDGEGRRYQHPPGRPNDRETLIPWFADWAEVPSSEPLPEAEVERAKQIADPAPDTVAPSPDQPPPRNVAELEALKRQEAEAHARHEAERQLEREAERESHARAFWAEQQAEAARREQAEKAQVRLAQALDKRLSKEWQNPKEDQRHLVALDVIELAGSDPEKFARLYNLKLGTHLKPESMRAMARDPIMLDITAREVLAKYGDADALDKFLGQPTRVNTLLDELGSRKDALGRRRLAALVHTNQDMFATAGAPPMAWADSLKLATKQPAVAVDKLRGRYGKDYASKWRAKYGDLAERMGAAEQRADAALTLTLEEAIERAKKLPPQCGTAAWFGMLKDDLKIDPDLRAARTLGEIAQVMGYAEVKAHAALLGHLEGLTTMTLADVEGMVEIVPNGVWSKQPGAHAGLTLGERLVRAAVRGGEQLADLTAAELVPATKIGVDFTDDGREYALRNDIYLTSRSTVSVVAHELVHQLEKRTPALALAGGKFLDARTVGMTPRKLNDIFGVKSYGEFEVAYENAGFVHVYAAKEYNHRGPTATNEVTTVGVQMILEGDLSLLYEKDPAHLWFVLSQLRGGK